MKKLAILGILLVVVLAGGAISSYMVANNSTLPVPVLTTTVDPDASVTTMVGWKAEQLFILVSFIAINLIGIGITVAIIMWFVDRGIRRSRLEVGLVPVEGEANPGKQRPAPRK